MWGLAEESIPTHTDQLAQVLSDQIGSLPAPHRLFDAETFGPRTGFATQSADCTLTDGRILEVQTFRVSTPHGLEGRTWRFIDVTKPRAETQLMIQNQKLEGLGILADGIAHEFNNLLATIVGNAELIRENLDDDADSSTSLEELEGAALQASERTRQLIAYAGKASFERETINLGELVREVGELSAVSFPGHVKLDFRLHPNLPLVRAGAPELRQVVMNFLMNSADALGEKPGTITVTSGIGQPDRMPHAEASVEYGDPADVGLYVQVSDDGCGINPLVINQVFDPFFTTKFAGRGLGLAASRGILESHSASFRVESILGIGSRFSFLLPLNSDSDQ